MYHGFKRINTIKYKISMILKDLKTIIPRRLFLIGQVLGGKHFDFCGQF